MYALYDALFEPLLRVVWRIARPAYLPRDTEDRTASNEGVLCTKDDDGMITTRTLSFVYVELVGEGQLIFERSGGTRCGYSPRKIDKRTVATSSSRSSPMGDLVKVAFRDHPCSSRPQKCARMRSSIDRATQAAWVLFAKFIPVASETPPHNRCLKSRPIGGAKLNKPGSPPVALFSPCPL